jgi:hypothetical protein
MIERREKSSQGNSAADRVDALSGAGIIPIAASVVMPCDPQDIAKGRYSRGSGDSERGDRSELYVARLHFLQRKCKTGPT